MVNVYDLDGKKAGTIEVPQHAVRSDIIGKVVHAAQLSRRQPYGANVLAGKRTSAHYHGKREYRYTMMNKEMSRIPRIHGSVGNLAYTARFAPHAVKGRRAHPPTTQKVWTKKINARERSAALRYALRAACNVAAVQNRGHRCTEAPLLFVDDFERLEHTKAVKVLLEKIFPDELERCRRKTVRAGRGTLRGRRYRTKKGPLVVVTGACPAERAVQAIPGIEVCHVDALTVESLAPGAVAGRLIITTQAGFSRLQQYIGDHHG